MTDPAPHTHAAQSGPHISWFPAGSIPGGAPPTELKPYLGQDSQWSGYLRAYLAAQPDAVSLIADLDWLVANREATEASRPRVGHLVRSMRHENRDTRHRYQAVEERVRRHLRPFVREFLKQTGARGDAGGAVGFRSAREADGVSSKQVAEAIYDTAQRMTRWAAELTETGIRFSQLFGHGDGSRALTIHDSFLTVCTECRSAVTAWRAEDNGETRQRVDETFAAMCRADEEFAVTAARWLQLARKELQAHAKKLEKEGLAAFHADLQNICLLGESIRAVLGTTSAVLAFTPAASLSVVLSGVAAVLLIIDKVAVEVTVHNSTNTDAQILDHTGMHVEHPRGSDVHAEVPTMPTAIMGVAASAVNKGSGIAQSVLPNAVHPALDVAGLASGTLSHLTGPAGAVISAANLAVHAYEAHRPPRIVADDNSNEKKHTAQQLFRHNVSLRQGERSAGAVRSAAEQVWLNALHATGADTAWLDVSERVRLQNPLTVSYESVVFHGETSGHYVYGGTLLYDERGSLQEMAAMWTITPEGVLRIDEATMNALTAANGHGPQFVHTHGAADEREYIDFAARARDEEFMDAGLEGGWLVEGTVNENFPWPTAPAQEAVRGRLHHLLLANDEPSAPYFTYFVQQIDLPNLHNSGVMKHWLTQSGSPDEAYPYWTDDAWAALQERLSLGY